MGYTRYWDWGSLTKPLESFVAVKKNHETQKFKAKRSVSKSQGAVYFVLVVTISQHRHLNRNDMLESIGRAGRYRL